MAKPRPALFGQMRHHRREQQNQDFRRLAEGVAHVRRDLLALHRADGGAELVGQIMHLRDGAIEAQALDILLDLDEARMRRPPDGGGGGEKTAGAGWASAPPRKISSPTSRHSRCTNLAAPWTPSSVQITSRSGGEFGEDEPARRIGAEGRDDLVRVDRIALRFRHFLDAADQRFPRRRRGGTRAAPLGDRPRSCTSAGESQSPLCASR